MAKEKVKEQLLDRQISDVKFAVTPLRVKKVTIKFQDEDDAPPLPGQDKSRVEKDKYGVESTRDPHPDFSVAFSKLTEHALSFNQMTVKDEAEKKEWGVCAINVKGNLYMNKARVTITLCKIVNRVDDFAYMTAGPITLSDESKYLEWKAVKKAIEKIFEEAMEYIGGKHENDETPLAIQLSVFTEEEQEEEKELKKGRKKPKVADLSSLTQAAPRGEA